MMCLSSSDGPLSYRCDHPPGPLAFESLEVHWQTDSRAEVIECSKTGWSRVTVAQCLDLMYHSLIQALPEAYPPSRTNHRHLGLKLLHLQALLLEHPRHSQIRE